MTETPSPSQIAICSETRCWRRPIPALHGAVRFSHSTRSAEVVDAGAPERQRGLTRGFRSYHLKVPQQMAVDLLCPSSCL
ncbi:hypothetical protein M407DRAFT_246512, partial [Tulasnella calospora MUT 4182]